jgi:hypothetical protein
MYIKLYRNLKFYLAKLFEAYSARKKILLPLGLHSPVKTHHSLLRVIRECQCSLRCDAVHTGTRTAGHHIKKYSTDMRRLTTEIRSEKCVVKRFRRCANVIECTYINLVSIVYYRYASLNDGDTFSEMLR